MFSLPAWIATLICAAAWDVSPGVIVDEVKGYALYLPSSYTPDRAWPVIFAFDPRGRGRTPVERYQAAAEKYGYIVAGSNVSRNGSWQVSMQAAQDMVADVGARFRVDPKRVYTAGMSGGARVAMGIAMNSELIAGVIASSAGYPDGKPLRKSLRFVVFGTAGTEDFNYGELWEIDHSLTSPHRVAYFEGGHVWLSSELAVEAVEWMELQAMASGRAPRNDDWLRSQYETRMVAASKRSGAQEVLALEAIAADFAPFRNVDEAKSRAAALRKEKPVRDEFKRLEAEVFNERRKTTEILDFERQLANPDSRPQGMQQLQHIWRDLAKEAAAAADTPSRRVARRVSRNLAMGVAERVQDAEYQNFVSQFAPRFRQGN